MSKLGPKLRKARAVSTATLDDAIAASGLTQFQLGQLVGIDDRAVRRLLDSERKRADRLDLLCAIEGLGKERSSHEAARRKPAAAPSAVSRHPSPVFVLVAASQAPGLAVCVDGHATDSTGSGLYNGEYEIIKGPTNRFGGGKPFARDTSGVNAPSSRAKHEGLPAPVTSAVQVIGTSGSAGSLPAGPDEPCSLRDGAVVARQAHNLEVVRSTRTRATNRRRAA